MYVCLCFFLGWLFVGLTQVEQAVLVEIVLASVRQASEGPTLAGRSGAKKVGGVGFIRE